MNRKIGIEHITKTETRNKWKKIVYQAERVSLNHEVKKTHFLTPGEWDYTDSVLCHYRDIQWTLDGGYQGAERKRLILYPDYLDPKKIDNATERLNIKCNTKGPELSHRDYLGSLLSIGIEREVIGDIVVLAEHSVIFVTPEIKEYIKYNLTAVGKHKVTVKDGESAELIGQQTEMDMIKGTVASLRIDSVISLALHISRQKAQALLDAKKVKLNWLQVEKNITTVSRGDVISINGFGRLVLFEIGSMSRSKRWHIQVGKLK